MKVRDYLIIGSLILISGILLLIVMNTGKTTSLAHVYYQNNVIVSIDFTEKKATFKTSDDEGMPDYGYPHYLISDDEMVNKNIIVLLGSYLDQNNDRTEILIEIDYEKNQVRVKEDKTPYQIAVNRGWYNGVGLPLISAPNEVRIEFVSSNNDVDVII